MLYQLRRDIGVQFKDLTYADELAKITARNITKYGDHLGPIVQWLRDQGKSWRDTLTVTADCMIYHFRNAETPKEMALQLQSANALLLGRPEMLNTLPI